MLHYVLWALAWYGALSYGACLIALGVMADRDMTKWRNPCTRYDLTTPYYFSRTGFWQLALLCLPVINIPILLLLLACWLASWELPTTKE